MAGGRVLLGTLVVIFQPVPSMPTALLNDMAWPAAWPLVAGEFYDVIH